ncbi:hypothetical protein [Dermacoccus sp. UBA1591]|uniref:hypothetical protein n=1 Tax=Dermacoccus sp. UBA1591 TaxID=1946405 RepID=UPI00257D481B|nr:hypothetical protein [Dermacoccus sp. UBA1591]
MTTTDLKPGDIVQHPEHGYGVVLKNFPGVPTIYFAGKHGYENTTRGFTGWERVKTVRPGHVQVRIDDLELGPSVYETEGEFVSSVMRDFPEYSEGDLRLIYRALVAQRAESTPPADEKPMSATVTLYCPDCGEPITNTAMVEVNREGDRYLDFCNVNVHTCPPAQPDEPTEFGAKATVAQADGHIERWLNMHAPPQGRRGWLTWDARDTAGSTPGQSKWADWSEIIQRGTVTLGWDE